jgi:hypothetical protein
MWWASSGRITVCGPRRRSSSPRLALGTVCCAGQFAIIVDDVDARDEWSAPRVLTSMSSVPEQTQPGSDEIAARVRGLDTSVAHPARVYDYLLGGKDNFAADREAAERLLSVVPFMRKQSRANRLFLGTAVHYLVRAGVRQFLDIGTGLPAANNTHEVAQRDAPDARIVYVDNDRCKSGCAHIRRAGRAS